jgi:Zn-dependent peptidase ImmA (M78 family)
MNNESTRQVSIVALLRDLVPKRPLTHGEALRIAELQANRLRETFGIDGPRLLEEVISELPRLSVRRDCDLPVSGVTYWEKGRWIIYLNDNEPLGRQRFSLFHEFKHVLDHTTKRFLYWDRPEFPANTQAERVADFFAGCILMPKRHVKRLFGQRLSLIRLADAFSVTPRAMHVRLSQIGLIEPTPRCQETTRPPRGRAHKQGSTSLGVAA